jgi:histone H3/H4
MVLDKLVHVKSRLTKRKFKPGFMALREIKKYQSTTHLLIPKQPFERLCREILQETAQNIGRLSADSLEALQYAAEDYLVSRFSDAQVCAIHGKREIVTPSDLKLAMYLRGDQMPRTPTDINDAPEKKTKMFAEENQDEAQPNAGSSNTSTAVSSETTTQQDM